MKSKEELLSRKELDRKTRKKHFDAGEFSAIRDLVKVSPVSAIGELQRYIYNYPEDLFAMCFYISTLISIREFGRAKVELQRFGFDDIHACKSKISEKQYRKILECFVSSLVKLFIHTKDYLKAYQLVNNYPKIKYWNFNGSSSLYFCKHRAGMVDEDDNFNYIFSQISNYSEERFLELLKIHTLQEEDDGKVHNDVFNADFPLDKALEEVRQIVLRQKNRSAFVHLFEDVYTFRYDNCGRVNNKMTNYFRVVTFHDTTNIITMCPAYEIEGLEVTDINYLREDNNVRRLSQIDKFNKKYGL